jgi:uncharacterized protein YciI
VLVIVLTYVKPFSEVDLLLGDHVAYLERNYQAGWFVASGRKWAPGFEALR